MPDITMCNQEDCPKKKKCYRYLAVPSQFRQSYFAADPRDSNGKCEYFMSAFIKELAWVRTVLS